jgi:hypothetical protein
MVPFLSTVTEMVTDEKQRHFLVALLEKSLKTID